jgi:hypothetical protein
MTDPTPPVHYSPPAKLVGDRVIACAARHWQLVSENPALVTCQPCQDPVAQALANARAARNKTSVNNPLNPHVDALLDLATRLVGLATGWEAEVPGLDYRADHASDPLQGTLLSARAQGLKDHAAEIRAVAAGALTTRREPG